MTSYLVRGAAILGLVVILAGCGTSGPKTYKIPGKLVYEDQSPVPGASVVLQTTIDGQVISARGMVGPDGAFELTTFKMGDGVVAGEHDVSVSPLPAPDGAPAPPSIPMKYWDFATSELRTTVTPETKEIVIKLDRAAK
jgi:hypothetical protein